MSLENEIEILVNRDGSIELRSQGLIEDELEELFEKGFENKTSLLTNGSFNKTCLCG